MEFDFLAQAPESRYRLLTNFVGPRPIAPVTARSASSHVRRDCLDAADRYVNPDVYQPIARLHADNHIISDRQFALKAPAIADVLKESDGTE